MAILYGIKKVVLTELEETTGLPPESGGIVKTIKTGEQAKLTPVIAEGEEAILRNATNILAVVREDDLLYGFDITFKDNIFDEDVAGLVAGYKVGKENSKTKLSTPMMSEGNIAKPFKMDIYIPNYEGDAIVNYCKITFNKCYGTFPEMTIGKEFFAPEFNIKARENTKAKLPTKSMDFVDALPADNVSPA